MEENPLAIGEETMQSTTSSTRSTTPKRKPQTLRETIKTAKRTACNITSDIGQRRLIMQRFKTLNAALETMQMLGVIVTNEHIPDDLLEMMSDMKQTF
jgi:hypothetical protein